MDGSEDVQRILRTTNLYEILGVDKTCANEDLKRSYRKLATKVHPDRCKAAGATEAFQKISHAYQTLSDETKRRNYDQFGDEIRQPTEQRQYYQEGGNARGQYYQYEIDPEDLFRAFFGGGFDTGATMRRRRRQYATTTQPSEIGSIRSLLLLLPIIVLFVVPLLQSVFGGFSQSNPLKAELEKEIVFPPPSAKVVKDTTYDVFQSAKYRRVFKVRKVWMRQMLRYFMDSRGFYQQLYSCADEIYETTIRMKCRQERKAGRAIPSCIEMKSFNVSP